MRPRVSRGSPLISLSPGIGFGFRIPHSAICNPQSTFPHIPKRATYFQTGSCGQRPPPRTGETYCAPSGLFLFRGFGSQGVALGYNIMPFQGLTLIFGLLRHPRSSALERAKCLPLRTICHRGSMGIFGALGYPALRYYGPTCNTRHSQRQGAASQRATMDSDRRLRASRPVRLRLHTHRCQSLFPRRPGPLPIARRNLSGTRHRHSPSHTNSLKTHALSSQVNTPVNGYTIAVR